MLQVYHISNLLFIAFNLGCAFSPNASALIVMRFLGKTRSSLQNDIELITSFLFRVSAGFAGAAGVAVGGGSVSDLFSERERASAMAAYSVGPLM